MNISEQRVEVAKLVISDLKEFNEATNRVHRVAYSTISIGIITTARMTEIFTNEECTKLSIELGKHERQETVLTPEKICEILGMKISDIKNCLPPKLGIGSNQ